jgi:hypothetical protein
MSKVTIDYFKCDNCKQLHVDEKLQKSCCEVELMWLERFKDCKEGDPIYFEDSDGDKYILHFARMAIRYHVGSSCLFLKNSNTYWPARKGSTPRPASKEDVASVKTFMLDRFNEYHRLRTEEVIIGNRLFFSGHESQAMGAYRDA